MTARDSKSQATSLGRTTTTTPRTAMTIAGVSVDGYAYTLVEVGC
jgi:hypothetical protein